MSKRPVISKEELAKPIPTSEVEEKVSMFIERFADNKELREHVTLKKRPFGEIIDELLPLAKYSKKAYNSEDIFLNFYPGSEQSFDADFYDSNQTLIERVEVTMAINGQQNLRQSEHLIEFNHYPMHKTLDYSGDKKKKKLIEDKEGVIVERETLITKYAELIHSAYEKKHINIHKYPKTNLLIGVDIALPPGWEYEKLIEHFEIYPNSFEKIYCVDISSGHLWYLK